MVLSANEVMLQHCVLKAVLTVLDSEPGLEYILDHEGVLASIFTSIQVYYISFLSLYLHIFIHALFYFGRYVPTRFLKIILHMRHFN
jgi:hypothetical protein